MGVGAGLRSWSGAGRARRGAIVASTIIVGGAADVRTPTVAAGAVRLQRATTTASPSPRAGRRVRSSTAPGPVAVAPIAAVDAGAGDPVRGTFGAQVAWPIMPIHAVLLPDGRVMSYGTDRNGVQTAYYEYDVWDPGSVPAPTPTTLLPNGTPTDIFCSSQIVLLNGDVELYGGDNLPAETNTQNRDVNQFHPAQRHARAHRAR